MFTHASHDRAIHALSIASIQDPPSERQAAKARHNFNQGRRCPVCGEPITNTATTCRDDRYIWQRITSSPRLLAWWIIDVWRWTPEERAGLAHIKLCEHQGD